MPVVASPECPSRATRGLVALGLLVLAGCGVSTADVEPHRTPQAGQPLDPLATAGRIAAIPGAALVGNQDAVRQQMEGFSDDYRRSINLADPARAVDREGARIAARSVAGVRSVVWVDRDNLLAIVERNEQRSEHTIDAVCRQLESLGDTLGVVVNLQSGAAQTGDELEILSRDCQLTGNERALFQSRRKLDVIPPEIRRQHRGQQTSQSPVQSRREADEAMRVLQASTPEL